MSQAPCVLVAGASGAIGIAVAEAFAAAHAADAAGGPLRLALHYRSRAQAVEELRDRLTAEHVRVHLGQADLCHAAQARTLVEETAAALDMPDTLVISVGGAEDKPLFLLTGADMAATLTENLLPVVNLVEAFVGARGERPGGRIIVLSSITGLVGQPMRAAYAAAKGAVIAYAKSVAREVAPRGMTVNCVTPQVVEGGLARRMKPAVRRLLMDNTPLGRTCQPSEVAAAAVYLASPGAAYATGTTLNLTGGLVTW